MVGNGLGNKNLPSVTGVLEVTFDGYIRKAFRLPKQNTLLDQVGSGMALEEGGVSYFHDGGQTRSCGMALEEGGVS